jgi:hypothetical protein
MRWDDAELEPHHQHHLFESSLARPIHLDGELSALDITIKKEVISNVDSNFLLKPSVYFIAFKTNSLAFSL